MFDQVFGPWIYFKDMNMKQSKEEGSDIGNFLYLQENYLYLQENTKWIEHG